MTDDSSHGMEEELFKMPKIELTLTIVDIYVRKKKKIIFNFDFRF